MLLWNIFVTLLLRAKVRSLGVPRSSRSLRVSTVAPRKIRILRLDIVIILLGLLTRTSKIQQIILSGLVEYVSDDTVAGLGDLLEVSICLELFHNVIDALHAEILLLDFDEFVQMILQLTLLKLLKIVTAQDHMLNQLSDLLIEFDYVWLSVDEVLNGLPVLEEEVVVGLLRTTSEAINQFTKHLRCRECLNLWLLDPEDVRVKIEPDLVEALNHLLFDLLWSDLVVRSVMRLFDLVFDTTTFDGVLVILGISR